ILEFNSLGNPAFPQSRRDNAFQFADVVSWTFPHHTVKLGADVLRYQLNGTFGANTRGTLAFGTLSDMVFNRNAVFTQFTGDDFLRARTIEIAPFVQDEWK